MKKAELNPEKISDALTLRAIQLRRPLTATFELTYRCNFNCKMCYVHMTDEQAKPYGRMRTVEEWLDMARQLKEAGVLNLKLTGGECTQYPGFNELYEQLAQMGFRIHLLSNAGAYTEAQKRLFEKYPPHFASITLYGASNETYARVTGDKKGFEKAVGNIRFFQSLGVRVGLGFTIIRDNVLDYPKVEELCRELNLSFSYTTGIHQHLRNPDFSQALSHRLSPAQRVCVEMNHPKDVEKALRDAEELEKELAYFSLPVLPQDAPNRDYRNCIGSHTSCAILWNGEMSTCLDFTGGKSYYPFEDGFEAAWQASRRDYEKNFQAPPQCLRCELLPQCAFHCQGLCQAYTGNPRTPALEMCQYTWLRQRYLKKLSSQEENSNLPSGASPCA